MCLLSSEYPIHKELAFVAAGRPVGRAAELLEFVFSVKGQRIVRAAGYLPLPRTAQ